MRTDPSLSGGEQGSISLLGFRPLVPLPTSDAFIDAIGCCGYWTVERVGETAAQPCFAGRVIAARVNGFVVHVSVASTETSDFLSQALVDVVHQLAVTAIPQLVTVTYRARHSAAGGVDGVLTQQVCCVWRHFTMPENNSTLGNGHGIWSPDRNPLAQRELRQHEE